jgi:hypothetical protein
MARKLHGTLINIKKREEDETTPVCQPSLSVYSRAIVNLRPFSAIFDKLTPDVIRN